MALVISRRVGESVVIGGLIRVKILRNSKTRVKLAIEAPEDMRVLRDELVSLPKSRRKADGLSKWPKTHAQRQQ